MSKTTQMRGVVFVSIGSRVMNAQYLSSVAYEAQRVCAILTVCLLDEPEIVNQIQLNGVSYPEALAHVQERCCCLIKQLAERDLPSVEIAFCKEVAKDRLFPPYLEAVQSLYAESRDFQSHCRNQIFRNLQPILRLHGVTSKRHDVTNDLAPYLLQEIAFKLFMADQELADIEFAPEPEMDILDAIYAGKYPALAQFTGRRLEHVVVQPLGNGR